MNLKNVKYYLLLILLAGQIPVAVFSQEETSVSEPLELPGMIIEDKVKLYTSSSVKQFPDNPSPLTLVELDSLNSLEKQQSLVLPVESIPEKPIKQNLYKGFVRGSYGRFTTSDFEAGYGLDLKGYKLYANGGFESSNGHMDKSGYTIAGLNIISDYIAPEKYWLFGGSNTRTVLNLDYRDFNLYSIDQPINRSLMDLGFEVKVDGNYEGYRFEAGADLSTLQLSQDNAKAFDNHFGGHLSIWSFWKKFLLGGKLEINLDNVRGSSTDFLQAMAFGSYTMGQLALKLKFGLQSAYSTTEISRGGLLIAGDLDYRLNESFTIRGSVSTGLEKNSFYELVRLNPYIAHNSEVDFNYNVLSLTGQALYHPGPDITFSAGIRFRTVEDFAVFIPGDTGDFAIAYEDAIIGDLFLEGIWDVSEFDRVNGNIKLSMHELSDFDNSIPNIPPYILTLDYRRTWFENFGTHFGVLYIGERYSDREETDKISGFLNINIGADYKIKGNLSIFGRLENLINSDIYMWKGYKERDLFISIGVLWQF